MVGRKIAKNEAMHRPWGIDLEFSCITQDCSSGPWDLTWFDSAKMTGKRQYCSGCKVSSPYVAFADIEGRYTNKLFPSHLPNVYWTPWPLPQEAAGLFYLDYSKENVAKRKGETKEKGKQVVKKMKI